MATQNVTPKGTFTLLLSSFLLFSMSQIVISQNLGSIVTPAFFNSIKNQAGSSCRGKRFYTRAAFLKAASQYPRFSRSISKREIAAFFAHVTHESGHFCYIEEIGGASRNYCEPSTQYPCAPGKKYYGRGQIQITWNYNYGAAGKAIGVNLLMSPETVARDPVVAFKTAFWFWVKNVRPRFSQGFGATIRAINGGECKGGNPAAVRNRIKYFRDYCRRFGVNPGPNLGC